MLRTLNVPLAMPSVYLYILTAIAFVCWLRFARRTSLRLNPEATLPGPGWTLGCWLIPIGTYFAPYRVVRKIWRASAPIGLEESAKRSRLPLVWWLLFVIERLSAMAASESATVTFSPRGHEILNAVLASCVLIRAAAAVLAMLLVHRLGALQKARAEQQAGPMRGHPAVQEARL